MAELLKTLEVLQQVDFDKVYLLLKVGALVLALIALAAGTYILRSVLGPLIRVVEFLFAYTPGTRPNDITAGLAHGIRLVAWSTLVGLGLWFFVL
jgi:hypothetical protein